MAEKRSFSVKLPFGVTVVCAGSQPVYRVTANFLLAFVLLSHYNIIMWNVFLNRDIAAYCRRYPLNLNICLEFTRQSIGDIYKA